MGDLNAKVGYPICAIKVVVPLIMRVSCFDRWTAPDAGGSALELLAQRGEEDLRGLPDKVRVRGGQRRGPVQAGALGGLLLQVEHVLQDLLVSLEPGKAVLLGLCGDLVAQLLDPLRGCLELGTDVRHRHVGDSSRSVPTTVCRMSRRLA